MFMTADQISMFRITCSVLGLSIRFIIIRIPKRGWLFFKRDVIPRSDSRFDIEMYGWNETVWNEINIASYSGGFA